MKKIIIIAVGVLIFLAVLWILVGSKLNLGQNKQTGPITLTFWGLWEDESLIKPLIEEYKKQNPNIDVTYIRQSSINYRTRVQTQIREGVGPDILMIHNSWVPMFKTDLYASPEEVFSLADYQKTFYPVSAENFVLSNQILAAPMEVDGLVLYYNEDILQAVGLNPPKNWQEFVDSAVKLTVKDSGGQIKTAGAALGTASNVDHWSDILGLLLLQQPNSNFNSLNTPASAEVLRFYADFVTDPKKKSWDINLPTSTDMFVSGRLAFYFAPSWRAHGLRQANPNLKFKISTVPQLPGKVVNWASFWALGVSSHSKNPVEAWRFVKFLTSAPAEKIMYQEAAKVRLFGQPYSLISLQSELINDPLVGAVVSQGPTYKSWYLNSFTFDLGINDEMIKYFEDGINSILAGNSPQGALQTIDQGVKQVITKYSQTGPVAPAR